MRAIHTKKTSAGFDYSLYYRGGGLKIEIDVHGDTVEDIVENIKGIGFEAELLEIEKAESVKSDKSISINRMDYIHTEKEDEKDE